MKNRSMRRFIAFALLATTILGAESIKIMPFGDSITYGDRYDDTRPSSQKVAYRNNLFFSLKEAGYDADFVGSEIAGQATSSNFDPDNEGHPGWTSYRLADHTYDFLEENPTDIMLIHAGSNDHTESIHGVENILGYVDYYEVHAHRRVIVILAKIINKVEYERLITDFNNDLGKMANRRIASGDSIVVVDMEHDAGLNTSDYHDNTHPNSAGYAKMANVWFKALMSMDGLPPDDEELRAYPYSLVDADFMDNVYVDVASESVTFTTSIPDGDIRFN